MHWTELENKIVYTLIDSHEVLDYFENNPEMFFDGAPPKKVFENAYETINEGIDNGTLQKRISDCFHGWLGRKVMDYVYAEIDEYIYETLEECKIRTDWLED